MKIYKFRLCSLYIEKKNNFLVLYEYVSENDFLFNESLNGYERIYELK